MSESAVCMAGFGLNNVMSVRAMVAGQLAELRLERGKICVTIMGSVEVGSVTDLPPI